MFANAASSSSTQPQNKVVSRYKRSVLFSSSCLQALSPLPLVLILLLKPWSKSLIPLSALYPSSCLLGLLLLIHLHGALVLALRGVHFLRDFRIPTPTLLTTAVHGMVLRERDPGPTMRGIVPHTTMQDAGGAVVLFPTTVRPRCMYHYSLSHPLVGRKRRRSMSPYDRERYDPRPRYGDEYGTLFDSTFTSEA